ncbi:hypothetical protein KBB17_02555 [Candidatus Saccharibacteria bacterium]|jgi:hypothetical protein|nr:hypothetical protein [Candidatus Saccharibacteria bacterium]
MTVYPEIPEATCISEGLDTARDIGACLLKGVIDVELLRGVVSHILTGEDPDGDEPEVDPAELCIEEALDLLRKKIGFFEDLHKSLQEKGLPMHNSLQLITPKIGDTIRAHADDVLESDDLKLHGITVLIPVYHGGRAAAYPDGVFQVANAPDDSRELRVYRRKPGVAKPRPVMPGDALALRQRNGNLPPAVHTSKSVPGPEDDIEAWTTEFASAKEPDKIATGLRMFFALDSIRKVIR